eukprot:TRINITY_DN2339_c0_g1_i5.p2 TRINITY_DN2339_c0_g1~~TRINITY_DN2339_c0_g1_i5.p2  ORF type:complete len:254 (-),score=44.76 TRINITY_DN2339_c0_g1_i5:930-1691(-)
MANLMRAFREKYPPPKSHLESLGTGIAVWLGEDGSATANAAADLWEKKVKPASDRWYALKSAYCDDARDRFARMPAVSALSLAMARRWAAAFVKENQPEGRAGGKAASSAVRFAEPRDASDRRGGRHAEPPVSRPRGAAAAAAAAAKSGRLWRGGVAGRSSPGVDPPRRPPQRFGDLPEASADEEGDGDGNAEPACGGGGGDSDGFGDGSDGSCDSRGLRRDQDGRDGPDRAGPSQPPGAGLFRSLPIPQRRG